MTRDQLTPEQRSNVWPGFDLLDDRGWGYGVSVLDDGQYGWDGGLGTTWANVPSEDLVVVVLTQRAADHTGIPAVCTDVLHRRTSRELTTPIRQTLNTPSTAECGSSERSPRR